MISFPLNASVTTNNTFYQSFALVANRKAMMRRPHWPTGHQVLCEITSNGDVEMTLVVNSVCTKFEPTPADYTASDWCVLIAE